MKGFLICIFLVLGIGCIFALGAIIAVIVADTGSSEDHYDQ